MGPYVRRYSFIHSFFKSFIIYIFVHLYPTSSYKRLCPSVGPSFISLFIHISRDIFFHLFIHVFVSSFIHSFNHFNLFSCLFPITFQSTGGYSISCNLTRRLSLQTVTKTHADLDQPYKKHSKKRGKTRLH